MAPVTCDSSSSAHRSPGRQVVDVHEHLDDAARQLGAQPAVVVVVVTPVRQEHAHRALRRRRTADRVGEDPGDVVRVQGAGEREHPLAALVPHHDVADLGPGERSGAQVDVAAAGEHQRLHGGPQLAPPPLPPGPRDEPPVGDDGPARGRPVPREAGAPGEHGGEGRSDRADCRPGGAAPAEAPLKFRLRMSDKHLWRMTTERSHIGTSHPGRS